MYRVVRVWLSNDQLAACLGHPLNRIEDKALGELAYVLSLVRLLADLDLVWTRSFG